MPAGRWKVEFHSACEAWAETLDANDQEALLAGIRILRDQGPVLGRPLVDTIRGSSHSNMKELRPGSTGRTEIRVLFAFDLERTAILLVGGDKSDDWQGWYKANLPIADTRLTEHQERIERRRRSSKRTGAPNKPKGRK